MEKHKNWRASERQTNSNKKTDEEARNKNSDTKRRYTKQKTNGSHTVHKYTHIRTNGGIHVTLQLNRNHIIPGTRLLAFYFMLQSKLQI